MISNLITDRTQADVAYLKAQREKILNEGWAALSEAEQMEYLAGLKGGYNATDLNRVTHAMEYLVERIRSYGYAVKYEKVKVPHQPQRGKSRLPAGYTELEYIESTGTQYIDTGFVANQDTRVVMVAEHSVTNAVSWLFGVRTATGKNMYAFLAYQNKYRTDYNTTITSYDTATTTMTNVDKDKNITTLNGTEVITNTYASFDCQYPLFLLAMNTAGTASGFTSAKVKIMKIYDNGAIVRNYVPCKDSNGEIGLYDLVNKSFVGNSGSGEFLAGGEIIPRQLPEGYTQVTYIQSSGTQYIDTGFKHNQDTRVVMRVQATSISANAWVFEGRDTSSTGRQGVFFLHSSKLWSADFDGAGNRINFEGIASTDELNIDFNKNVCAINGISKTLTNDVFTSSYNLTLLAANTGGTIAGYVKANLYSCQIYDSGILVRDFVPCVNSKGIAGLIDLVNNVFYANAGTGKFAIGTVIEAPSYEEPYDDYMWYIEDIPQAKELGMYLQNTRNLRNTLALFSNTPSVPDDMERFTFEEANNIETILVNIETIINLMVASFIYSGEIFSGEVI